ncbi:hypothetical protein L3X38_005648 [Prunus dulcis]|uniref:Reverse transcriptase Ty1/copia-type domain-containing protein n=1 Tax=Prunus dulcis TaxID=3755 RepID=A0AAD5F496_PRUDU|nr:hypothetical protein L3X38_005648 [Prunus dulcis]
MSSDKFRTALTNSSDTTPETTHDSLDEQSRWTRLERYKARLVAKGLYSEIWSRLSGDGLLQVAKINTVRILISLAANLDLPLHQFNVKNAFLHGDLEEEVYMDPLPGCNLSPKSKHYVCKLKKSLYGLKQSPIAWFGRLTKSMRAFGYKQSNFDHTLFLKHKENKIIALIVYVDDMIVTGDDPDERDAVNRILRYLKSTHGKGLMYSKQGHLDIIGYTDADLGWVPNRQTIHFSPLILLIIQFNMIELNMLEVDRHFIKERLEDKTLQFPFVKSEDQLADILTKAVFKRVFQDTLSKLDLGDIYAPT